MEFDKLSLDVLDDIIKDGIILNDQNNEPTLKEANEINEVILEFIKKKKLILYGGTAINEILTDKCDPLPDYQNKLPDYDFFSSDSNKDSIELCDILHKKGYRYVNRIMAIHEGTFKVRVNFHTDNFADVTYIPDKLLKQIPYIEIKGVRYASPEYLYIDFFKSFIDQNNLFRWEKDYTRYQKLMKCYSYYTLLNSNKKIKPFKVNNGINAELKKIDKYILGKSDIILSGYQAYKQYINIAKGTETFPLLYYDIYTDDIEKHTKDILKLIKGSKVTKYNPFLDHLPYSHQITLKGQPLINIYTSAYINTYIPYVTINKYKCVSFHYLLMFFYIHLLKYSVQKNEQEYYLVKMLIAKLYEYQEIYNKKNKLKGIEKSNPYGMFNNQNDNKQHLNRPSILTQSNILNYRGIHNAWKYSPEQNVKCDKYVYPNIDGSECKTKCNVNKDEKITELISGL